MHADIAISTKPSASSKPVGATHIQPPSATGSPPRIYSQEEHANGAFADNTNFTDAPYWSDATALDALRDQIRQIEAIDSGNQTGIVNVFRTLKESAGVIKRTLAKAPDDAHLWRMSDALVKFLRQFNHALRNQPDLSGSFDAHDVRSICLGLSACANPTAGIVFDAAQQRRAGPALQGITDSLLTQLAVLRMPESASANGVVLDILNWVSHGLKTELLEPNRLIRTSFGQALELFAGWLNGDHTRGFMSVKQIAKCAVQIDLTVKRKLVALDVDSPQGTANRTLLAQCATGLGSAAVLVQFSTGPTSSSGQGAVDAVALINVCNAFSRLLDARLLQAGDGTLTAPLSRLLALILRLPSPQLCAGTGQTLSNCSNFVRTLFELGLSAEPGLAPLLEKALVHLIDTVNGADFALGHADIQPVSNLMSFVKLCNKRLQAKAGSGKPGQAELIAAASVLYGQLMTHDPAKIRGAEAIGGLLSGLCYLWRSGLVAPSANEGKWVDILMRSVVGMDRKSWTDKSRKAMLPALLALIETGRLTLAAAQPALAVLSKEPASASSGYTLADLAQSVKRLGAVEEDVVALPPGVIAQQAGAPVQVSAQLAATLPRAIPGDTSLATPPAEPLPTRSTTTAPAQRRAPGGAAHDAWKTPARVARNKPLSMSATDISASQPTWSNAAASTAVSSTTASAATANSNTTTPTATSSPSTSAAGSATKKTKGGTTSTKGPQQKSAQQWFALLTNQGGIDLKRLQELARSQPGLVSQNDASGRNALFHALAAGNEKVVAWLMAQKSYVAPKDVAQFLTLLIEEVLLFSPALGAALKYFLAQQTVALREDLRSHFEMNPPIMKGMADILAPGSAAPSITISGRGRQLVLKMEKVTSAQGNSANTGAQIQQLREKAKQGDASAQFDLALLHYQGTGVVQDYKAAFHWYELAARQGHAEAQNKLGMMHMDGLSVKQDQKEAARWFRRAAEQGHAGAQNNLGCCYHQDESASKSAETAAHWLQLAAEQGDVDARFNLGNLYYKGVDVEKDEKAALHWYQLAAKQGDVGAQFKLGVMHEQGLGVKKDEKAALHWYQLAANQGDVDAQFKLGAMHEQGLGVKVDEKAALRWYQLAANQGDAEAQFEVGIFLYEGRGTRTDKKAGMNWLQMAARQGHATAQLNLGVIYQNGIDVAMDEREAARWFRMAADQGNATAIALLSERLVSSSVSTEDERQ